MPSSRGSFNPGIEPCLPHCRWILQHLSHQGSPSEGIGGVIFSGQDFLKRIFFKPSLESCDYTVKNLIFPGSQFYNQNLDQKSAQIGPDNKGGLVPAGIVPLGEWGSKFDQPQAVDYRRKVLDMRELQSIFPSCVNKDLIFYVNFLCHWIIAIGCPVI